MIGWESRVLLRHYLEEGLSQTEIAELLGMNRKTVARWIQGGELDRDLDEPVRYKPRPPVVRKLDPYKAIIQARLEAYPKLSAVRLLEEIRAAGYAARRLPEQRVTAAGSRAIARTPPGQGGSAPSPP